MPDNIKEIPLTKGQVALVDAENYEWLMQWKWYAAFIPKLNNYYAARNVVGRKKIKMHRQILGLTDPKIEVDHRNRNGLHNYKSNLRLATKSQNMCNRRPKQNSSSKYLGVCWYKRGFWVALIKPQGCKRKYLGGFKNEDDAGRAYDKAAKEIHGEFACLNFK